MRAESDRRLDHLDEIIYGSWHGAVWGREGAKIPDLDRALTKRVRSRDRPISLDAEIAQWDRWAKAGQWQKGN